MSTTPENTPPTVLDICNLALSRLGESPIPALDPNGSLPARLCYMHYHPVRREVLCLDVLSSNPRLLLLRIYVPTFVMYARTFLSLDHLNHTFVQFRNIPNDVLAYPL